MGSRSIMDWIKDLVNWISWRLFLWSIGRTATEYWTEIYDQEARYLMEQKQSYLMIERGFLEELLSYFVNKYYLMQSGKEDDIIHKLEKELSNRR